MKDYYLAQVQIIIDEKKTVIIPISGQGYNPNVVKGIAIEKAKEAHEGSSFSAVIISKEDYNLDEYKTVIGGKPPWLGGD